MTRENYRKEGNRLEEKTAPRIQEILKNLGFTVQEKTDENSQIQGIDYVIELNGVSLNLDAKAVDTSRMLNSWDRMQQQNTSVEWVERCRDNAFRKGWGQKNNKTELVFWYFADSEKYGMQEWFIIDHKKTRKFILENPNKYPKVKTKVGLGAEIYLVSAKNYIDMGALVACSWGDTTVAPPYKSFNNDKT